MTPSIADQLEQAFAKAEEALGSGDRLKMKDLIAFQWLMYENAPRIIAALREMEKRDA